MESIINDSITDHLENNSLLSEAQFGFRKHHSTIHPLVSLSQDCCDALDHPDRREVRVVALDISRAFDSVWHRGLLAKLEHQFGIRGKLLQFLRSYLSHRHQFSVVDGKSSSLADVGAGVPQGSILGPTLFIAFINDLVEVIKHSSPSLYADDTTLHKIVPSASHRVQCAQQVSEDLQRVSEWAEMWQVTFRPEKTQSMVVSRKKDLQTNPHPPIMFQGTALEEADNITLLGVTLSNTMSWVPHTIKKATSAARLQGMMYRSRNSIPAESLAHLYKSCVRSTFEYASPVWNGAPDYVLRSFDKLQDRCQNMFPNHPLEPLSVRRNVAGLSLVHQAFHGHCPPAAKETILSGGLYASARVTRGSVAAHPYTIRRKTSRTAHHSRSFGPHYTGLWNSLPNNIVETENPAKFRSLATAHYMSNF